MHTEDQSVLRDLRIEDTGVPIYVQLRDQFQAAVGAGRIAPGARMPTMREVAVALRVDLNTVRRAYEALERQGVVVLARGRGSFVAERPSLRPPDAAKLDQAAHGALAGFAAAGLDPAAVAHRILALAAGKAPEPEKSP